jgi:hypothetical protein
VKLNLVSQILSSLSLRLIFYVHTILNCVNLKRKINILNPGILFNCLISKTENFTCLFSSINLSKFKAKNCEIKSRRLILRNFSPKISQTINPCPSIFNYCKFKIKTCKINSRLPFVDFSCGLQ